MSFVVQRCDFDQAIDDERQRIENKNQEQWRQALLSGVRPIPAKELVPERKQIAIESVLTVVCEVLVEAKPKLPNPMEVLRQLKNYRKFLDGRTVFILWCPTIDDRTRQIFTSQGFYVSSLPIEIVEQATAQPPAPQPPVSEPTGQPPAAPESQAP